MRISTYRLVSCLALAAVLPALSLRSGRAYGQRAARPNIVLMFPDNLGWGEVGVYGGVRGAPTPRLDGLAAKACG